MRFRFAGESNSAQTSTSIGRNFKPQFGHYRSFTILIRINVTGTGFAVCEGRHEKMPAHHRRMAIALMTRWFEHVQVGGAFNDTIFAIFSEDSPLGRFADGEVISFDEETPILVRLRTWNLRLFQVTKHIDGTSFDDPSAILFHKGNCPSSRFFLIYLDRLKLDPFTNVLPRTALDPPSPVTRVVRLALQVLLRSPTPVGASLPTSLSLIGSLTQS